MRWAALVWVVVCANAYADDVSAAREHYQAGTKAYEVGEYDEAVREFSAAYKAKSDPVILFNIGQSQRLAGHNVEAERAYRMYLSKVPNAPNRADIERLIGEMQKQKPGAQPQLDDPDIELVRRHFRAGAELYSQEKYPQAVAELEQARAIKPLPTLDFNIARCYDRMERLDDAISAYERYLASKPGDADEVRTRVETLKARRAAKMIAPKAEPPKAEPVKAEPVKAQPMPMSTAGRSKKIAGIAVGAVGVLALGAGIAMGVLSQNENDRLSHPAMGTRFDDLGLAYQNASIGLYVVGGVALVTGVVLFVVGHREAHRPSLQAKVGF